MRSAGALDRRIRLLQFVPGVENAYGEPAEPKWEPLGPHFASKQDISDGERVTAQGVGMKITTRFEVRSSTLTRSLKPQDRVEHDGRLYDIVGIKDAGRRDIIELTCAAAEQAPAP